MPCTFEEHSTCSSSTKFRGHPISVKSKDWNQCPKAENQQVATVALGHGPAFDQKKQIRSLGSSKKIALFLHANKVPRHTHTNTHTRTKKCTASLAAHLTKSLGKGAARGHFFAYN